MLNVNIFVILQDLLTETPLYGIIEYCLKIIPLTQADSYIVLRATNLNDLLKFVIYLLKREIISMYMRIYIYYKRTFKIR